MFQPTAFDRSEYFKGNNILYKFFGRYTPSASFKPLCLSCSRWYLLPLGEDLGDASANFQRQTD